MTETEEKLREAGFFLDLLKGSVFEEHFGYYLSAFISAARSVTWVMRHEFAHQPGWEEWFTSRMRSPEEALLLEGTNSLRIRTTKKQTPESHFSVKVVIPPGPFNAPLKELLVPGQHLDITMRPADGPVETQVSGKSAQFSCRIESIVREVTEFQGEDIVFVCSRYFSWLQGLVCACLNNFA